MVVVVVEGSLAWTCISRLQPPATSCSAQTKRKRNRGIDNPVGFEESTYFVLAASRVHTEVREGTFFVARRSGCHQSASVEVRCTSGREKDVRPIV